MVVTNDGDEYRKKSFILTGNVNAMGEEVMSSNQSTFALLCEKIMKKRPGMAII